MKGNKEKSKHLGFPIVVAFCCFSFICGFFGSVLFLQDPRGNGGPRLPQAEVTSAAEVAAEVPHGESGESQPSSVTFQVGSAPGRKKMNNGIYGTVDSEIDYNVLSWKPRVVYFPKFATAEQCQGIINITKSRLKPSKLAFREGETAENTKGVRTSTGTFISSSEDPTGILDQIEQKIARMIMVPMDHGEAFNILRYEIRQSYASHMDAFDPAEYGPQYSQRVATFLVYLSDVEEGGETIFPYENGLNMDIGYDYRECIGLKVKPCLGDALLFYSVFTNGTIDPKSLHGSCPVIKGEKWVATKWIRDQIHYDVIDTED